MGTKQKELEEGTVTVDVDVVHDVAKETQLLEELVDTRKSIQEIADDIQKKKDELAKKLTDQWGEELAELGERAGSLQGELDGLTEGKGFKHPDGRAELVVKFKTRRGGKAKEKTLALMEEQPEKYGPPSNFFIEVPATMKLRGMAEVDKTVTALSLDAEEKEELYKLLNISGGQRYTELVIHDILEAVEEAIMEDKGGGT